MKDLQRLTAAARGDIPCDLVLGDARIVNTYTCEVVQGSVGICGENVAGIGEYRGIEQVDLEGRYLSPGFTEAHFHIESTLLRPSELTRLVLPRGTTAMVCDPHEIANVSGMDGIEFLLADSEGTPLDIFLMAPSCVPATEFDRSGATITARDIEHLYRHPRVLGLGEVMDFAAVVEGRKGILDKIRASAGRPVDGHAPLLSGKPLCAYIAAGPDTDHECSRAGEALEKCRLGMMVMIRQSDEDPVAFRALLSVLNDLNCGRFMLVSDDRPADALFSDGHIDHLLRQAVGEGVDPLIAIRMVTLNPARHYGFRNRGAIAPGNLADLVVLEDLLGFEVHSVYKSGRKVGEGGRMTVDVPRSTLQQAVLDTVHPAPGNQQDFRLNFRNPHPRARIMELLPGTILTNQRITEVTVGDGGFFSHDPAVDIAAVHVLDRYRASGGVSGGLVKGFGLSRGALASTFSHDSHNLICVSTDPVSAHTAVCAVVNMGGGFSVAMGDRVLASLSLPVCGLLTDAPYQELLDSLQDIRKTIFQTGCSLKDPFTALSFLSLTVIPELRITERGLFDVTSREFVKLEVE